MDNITEKAIAFITGLFSGNSDGHDMSHTMRVYRRSMKISETHPEADRTLVALIALLHDADDHKNFSNVNNENARKFLTDNGVSSEVQDSICRSINEISFSMNRDRRPSSPEAMIVQDADRIDAMGAVGIARTFAYGGKHGRTLEESIGHFQEKLLKLRDMMNTEEGKAQAEELHAFMVSYLDEFGSEISE